MCYMGCPHEGPTGTCKKITPGGYCDDEYWEEEAELEESEPEEEDEDEEDEPAERENPGESRASAS